MLLASIPKPAPGEYAAAFHPYIGPLTEAQVPGLLSGQPARLREQVGGLSEEAALARYAPGKWSIKEVLGHLSDVERVMGYRLLRIARGDTTPLPGFDENDYVARAGFDRRRLASLLDHFDAVRGATAALVQWLPPEAWTLQGTMSGATISARALLYIIVGHVAHHGRILRERYGVSS